MTTKKQPVKKSFVSKAILWVKGIHLPKVRLPEMKPGTIMGSLLIIYLAFLSQQLVTMANDVNVIATEQVQMQTGEQAILNTAAPRSPTATLFVGVPPTPILQYESFVTTKYEVRFRGGNPLTPCPKGWVVVVDAPSTTGHTIGCLAPYMSIRIETKVDNKDVLVRENGNVWGLIAGQTDCWAALKTTSRRGVVIEYFNWHE